MSAKIEEGDFIGAVRFCVSEDTFAPFNDTTYNAFLQKHPAPPPDNCIPPLPDNESTLLTISEEEVARSRAIRSFPNGSAGGPDGLRPQHLKKDLTGPSAGNGGKSLLTALSLFSSLVIQGKVPTYIRPFFFGANLIALEKKDGGIRLIAVGCTLRSLVAKIAGNKLKVTCPMTARFRQRVEQKLQFMLPDSTCTLYHLICCF